MTRGERIRFYVMLACFITSAVGGTLSVVYAIGPRWALVCFVIGVQGSAKSLITLSRKALGRPAEQVKA